MRIAICLCGQARTWRRCHESIRGLFPGHEVEFYIHHWRTSEQAEILAAYRPKAYLFEDPPGKLTKWAGQLQGAKDERRRFDLLCQWYSVWRSASLRKGKHDLICRIRPDVLFQKPLTDLLEHVAPNRAIVPHWSYPRVGQEAATNDHLALCGPVAWRAYRRHLFRFRRMALKQAPVRTHVGMLTAQLESAAVEILRMPIRYLLVRPAHDESLGYEGLRKVVYDGNEHGHFQQLVRVNHK